MWDRRAQILDVHDGDTLHAVLDQGFGDSKEITVRLLGVWAPELSQPGGPETRAFVKAWLDTHSAAPDGLVVVTTARTPRSDKEVVTLSRYVATVTSMDGTENLNLAIMEFVRQRGYGGGTGS